MEEIYRTEFSNYKERISDEERMDRNREAERQLHEPFLGTKSTTRSEQIL